MAQQTCRVASHLLLCHLRLQFLDKKLMSKNIFVGFYNPSDSKGETLANILTRMMIPLEKLAGFSFDNAANMSGKRNGVQARLKEKMSMEYLCSLLQSFIIFVPADTDILFYVEKISSARELTSLSQTRWCVRGKAIKTAVECYKDVKDTLTHLANDKKMFIQHHMDSSKGRCANKDRR